MLKLRTGEPWFDTRTTTPHTGFITSQSSDMWDDDVSIVMIPVVLVHLSPALILHQAVVNHAMVAGSIIAATGAEDFCTKLFVFEVFVSCRFG